MFKHYFKKRIKMKNYIYSSILLFFLSVNIFGQSPDSWFVNENNFEYTMSFVTFVNIDGADLANTNDKVAAFVNGECRGVTNLIYVASKNRYYAYLTVFSNANEEVINFKIYDSANNTVKNVIKKEKFEINEHYGNLFQAYSLASPALSSSAEIIDFKFKDVIANDLSISGNKISIDLDNKIDITSLSALFELSTNSKLFIGTENIVSGNNLMDYSYPVEFQVLSADQSVLKQWLVTVNSSLGTALFYKKDAVCYKGGAIKVLFTKNNEEVVLSKAGIAYATQNINNGETTFSNLETGVYTIKVGGNVKEIIINLKE